MRCIKTKKLNRGSYNLRQSQDKMLDIQNGWNDDWMPLDQSLSLSLLSLFHIFFLYRYTFVFSADFSRICFFLWSFTYWEIWPLTNSNFVLYDWPNTFSGLVFKKKKKIWLGAQLWMNQVRCGVEVVRRLCCTHMWLRGRTHNPGGDHKRVSFTFQNYSMLNKKWRNALINAMS